LAIVTGYARDGVATSRRTGSMKVLW